MIAASFQMFKHCSSIYMYILYAQAFELLMMVLHFLLIGVDYGVFYLMQEVTVTVLPTIISYFFIKEVGKITERQTKDRKILLLLVGANLVYCAGLLTSGIVLMLGGGQVFSCKSWIWIFSSCSGILYGGVLLGFAVFLKLEVKNWSIYSASRFNYSRFTDFLVFAFALIVSYCVMLFDSVYKLEYMESCFDYCPVEVINIFLFIFIRMITHYMCTMVSMYIFWPRIQENLGLSMKEFEKMDISTPSLP